MDGLVGTVIEKCGDEGEVGTDVDVGGLGPPATRTLAPTGMTDWRLSTVTYGNFVNVRHHMLYTDVCLTASKSTV